MKKIFLPGVLIFNFSFLIFNCFSQQLPLTNQFTLNKFSLSPAYAGTGDGFQVFGTYRNEWVGISGAPETKIITADGMIFKNMGLGGSISSVDAGIFRNQSASFSYAYHAKLGSTQTLSFGLSFGLLDSYVDVTGTAAQSDPVAANNQNINAMVLDGGFGILYRCKKFRAAVSLPRMLSSKIKNADGKTAYTLVTQQQVDIGYKYSFNPDWTIDPSMRISMMLNNANTVFSLAVPIIYKQKVWLLPIFKNTSQALGIGGILYNNFIAQYTYEFSGGDIGQLGGTHEITIGWRMVASKKKSDVPAPDPKKPYYQWLK